MKGGGRDMYQFLANMWIMRKVDEDYLQIMVEKEFLTEEEYEMIVVMPQI